MATILIVDDEPAACRSLTDAFDAAGHAAHAVRGGADALELLRTVLIDVVVLDIMMPGIDGLDVLRDIRADPRTAGQKVVLYSNVAALFADDPRARSADRVLSKSLPLSELLTEVEILASAGRR